MNPQGSTFIAESQMEQIKYAPTADPKQTIYIKNLNEKVKPKEMKEALFHFCSTYGEVMDIFIKSNIKMRGQAFVCFKSKQDAESAIDGLQGFFLFGKQLKAQYARQSSDIIKQINGTFKASVREKRHEKRANQIEKYRLQNRQKQQERNMRIKMQHEMIQQGRPPIFNNANAPIRPMELHQQQPFKENAKDVVIPNKKLFIDNIEERMTVQKLKECFGQFNGFIDLSYIKQKHVAFVDFTDEPFATTALDQMNGRVILEEPLQITYAKA